MNSMAAKVTSFCNEWKVCGMTNVYFRNIEELYGLDFDNSTLDGMEIARDKALNLRKILCMGEVWLDLYTCEFNYSGLDEVVANCIIDKIKSEINGDAYCERS